MLLAGCRGGGDLPPEQRFCRPSLEQTLNRVALSPACRSDCRRQFVDDLTRLPGGPQSIGCLLQGRCVHPAMIAGKEPTDENGLKILRLRAALLPSKTLPKAR